MTRYRAFAIHLGISLAIFTVLAYLVLMVWYPDLFFDTDGGWQGMRIIIAVDLILGPLLTLIVYKHGKPGLKFDLTCIATFQIACLIAGTYLVFSERPLAIVYVDGQFSALSRESFTSVGMDVPDLDHIPGDYPKWIMIDVPGDLFAQADLRTEAFKKGLRLELVVDRYLPFNVEDPSFRDAPTDIEDLLISDETTQQLPRWLAQHGGTLNDYRFYPYGSRYKYLYLGYRDSTSELLGILDTPIL
jgi:hypothetical protein